MSLPHRQQHSASTRHTTEIQSGRFAVSLRCTSVADSLHRSNRRCVFGMTFQASFQTTFVSTHVRYVFNAECPTPSIFSRHTIVVPTPNTISTMQPDTNFSTVPVASDAKNWNSCTSKCVMMFSVRGRDLCASWACRQCPNLKRQTTLHDRSMSPVSQPNFAVRTVALPNAVVLACTTINLLSIATQMLERFVSD